MKNNKCMVGATVVKELSGGEIFIIFFKEVGHSCNLGPCPNMESLSPFKEIKMSCNVICGAEEKMVCYVRSLARFVDY